MNLFTLHTFNPRQAFSRTSTIRTTLLCAVIGLLSTVSSAEETAALAWPTSQGQIQMMRIYGLTSGSVENTGRAFENWGGDSSVTWQVANNIPGDYSATLTYRSSQDVAYSLTIGDVTHEGVMKKGEGTLKEPIPAVTLDRIGVCLVTLSVADAGPDADFALTDFRMRFEPGRLVMSKPVLIAGGDWIKIQASVEVLSKDVDPENVRVRAAIRPWPEGDTLWKGELPVEAVSAGLELDHTLAGLEADLWSPDAPNLYNVRLDVRDGDEGEMLISSTSRIGFRDFETKNGRFYLNGQAVFLRGNSIMPPGWDHNRGLNPEVGYDPEEIRKYIAKMKSFNVNLIRVHDPLWLSLCDELGMMVFTGRYGVPKWGGAKRYAPPEFEEDAVRYYKHLFSESYMNHPSVVIWVLTNEMPSALTENGHKYIVFLRQVYDRLSKWDPTRAYIENAGFGYGQAGDVNDFHVYVGWYNGIVQSLYKFREDLRALTSLRAPLQPMTFTEMIGAYVDTLGRMPATGKMVAASVMWTGNDSDVPEAAFRYQEYLTQQFLEILRRMRPLNPAIAGTMPFTNTAAGWELAESVEDIEFNPHIANGFTTSYQPVLLSFENWRPHVYAGESPRITAHLVNDADDGRNLQEPQLEWRLVREDNGRTVDSGRLAFSDTVLHYHVDARELLLEISEEMKTGRYLLKGEVVENGKTVSTNETPLWIESRRFEPLKTFRKVTLYDPLNETRPVLEKAGLVEGRDFFMTTSPFTGMRQFDQLSGSQLQETMGVEEISGDTLVAPSRSVLIVGTQQWVEPLRDKYLLMNEFIRRGGRVLFLHPNAPALNDSGVYKELMVMENEWIGDQASVNMESLWHTSRYFGAWINPRRSDTGIFEGIDREHLWLWSDPSGWDPSQPGLPEFEPVSTFLKLRDAEALDSTAILANFGRGLEHVALAEVFRGEGSVILSGFGFDRFAGFDPIADKVLRGIIRYAADDQEHAVVPVAKKTTNIGSPSDEDGQIPSEFRNGLLLEYYKSYEDTIYFTGFRNEDYQVRRIAGPFWFNRLCHTKPINPENPIRHGFIHVRPPEGVTEAVFMIRRIPTRENKGSFDPANVKVSIGDQTVEKAVPGVEEVELRIALPLDQTGPYKVEFEGLIDMGISSMSLE